MTKTYHVRATALTDLIAYFDVEADTPEEAKAIAEAKIAGGNDDIDFNIADDRCAPIFGTEEIESVTIDDDETVFDTVTGAYLKGAIEAYSDGKNIVLAVDEREHATILAALRYWQREGLMSSGHEHDIATIGDTVKQLTADEIGKLCERIN